MLLACSLVIAALAGTPAGARHMETSLQDDAVFLHRSPAAVRSAAHTLAWLGVDRLRVTAGWSALAPAPQDQRRPAPPFDPADSRTYPAEGWTRLDRAVKAARAAGLEVQIDVAFWAPRWAVQRGAGEPGRHRWAPDPGEFGRFAMAVARRYDGGFPDPERRGYELPAVRMYTTWNEPNSPDFLQPQWIRRGRRWVAASPHIYRGLHEAAYNAIKSVSRDNLVLVGGTASTGSRRPGRGGVPPLRFLRELACVDDQLRPLRRRECLGASALRADGWAHHPYSRWTTPGTSDPDPDDAPIADTGRLEGLLDALARAGRIAGSLPVYHTEYAYETNPPDPAALFRPEDQARFHSWSTWLAWRDPRARMFAQFLLRDTDPRETGTSPGDRRHWRGFQSGLFNLDGSAKPAVRAFRLPFWPQVEEIDGQRVVTLFGGVRPGHGRQFVRVERRDPATGAWSPVTVSGERCDSAAGEFLTDSEGWFARAAPYQGPAEYRLSRLAPDGAWEYGAELPLAGLGT
jgi:hypothetical protein